MERHTLTNDGQRNVRFTGELIAQASSRDFQGPNQNRWTELELYRTKAGKYVLQKIHQTCWQGEENSYHVTVCEDGPAVYAALTASYEESGERLGDLDKKLLKKAGLGDLIVQEIE